MFEIFFMPTCESQEKPFHVCHMGDVCDLALYLYGNNYGYRRLFFFLDLKEARLARITN